MLQDVGAVAGASVMGTGIVSVALELDGHHSGSKVLLWIAVALWLALAALLVLRLATDGDRVRRGAATPPALTAVAATGVLGSRFVLAHDLTVAKLALALAAVLWLVLIGTVVRRLGRRTPGAAFLSAVSTAALANLAGQIAGQASARWLLWSGLALLAVAVALYVDVLVRFDRRQVVEGHGDHWVAGGALAIAALAGANLTTSAVSLGAVGDDGRGILRAITLVLWIAAIAWLPVLVVAEIVRPRLGYDARRWATVFPLGMYAAMSLATGKLLTSTLIRDVGRIWTWIAFAVWLVVAIALVRRGAVLRAGQPGSASTQRRASA